jgi:RNA polymerase sigma-70 factor (ECF subfamily)
VTIPPDKLEAQCPPDADLMAALARDDRTALACLVWRHQQRVRAIAFRFTRRRDTADDIAQETFLRLWRSAGRYRPTAAFSTWLYRIVVNLCLDHAKRPRLAQLPGDTGVTPSGPSSDPLLRQEQQQAVARAIAALPERQRIALILHRFEALSHVQIAQTTGWSESAVESLLVRAYGELRRALRTWAEGP